MWDDLFYTCQSVEFCLNRAINKSDGKLHLLGSMLRHECNCLPANLSESLKLDSIFESAAKPVRSEAKLDIPALWLDSAFANNSKVLRADLRLHYAKNMIAPTFLQQILKESPKPAAESTFPTQMACDSAMDIYNKHQTLVIVLGAALAATAIGSTCTDKDLSLCSHVMDGVLFFAGRPKVHGFSLTGSNPTYAPDTTGMPKIGGGLSLTLDGSNGVNPVFGAAGGYLAPSSDSAFKNPIQANTLRAYPDHSKGGWYGVIYFRLEFGSGN